MSNFKFDVPAEGLVMLDNQVSKVCEMQEAGELPDYSLFNRRLMKGMATPNDELHHAATGIAGEAGEILDITKKVWVYNKPLDIDHLIEELGDLRFYIQATMMLYGISEQEVLQQNANKLSIRYKSLRYSDDAAIGRADKSAT